MQAETKDHQNWVWTQSLGIRAVLPSPEERRHAKTAIGAAKAEASADKVRSEAS
jgi:hypothetical protein